MNEEDRKGLLNLKHYFSLVGGEFDKENPVSVFLYGLSAGLELSILLLSGELK